jgi:hypothetical protein
LVSINSVIINEDVFTSKFCCNLEECKGICCCLKGGRGAPLNDDELQILEDVYNKIKDRLAKQSIDVIISKGLYEGSPGDYYINCIDDRDCIFVYYDNKIAKCIIEKAFIEGVIEWKKPISCHLYPIRINNFGGDVLRYSRISECQPAVKRGKENDINLIDFLKEPLIRKYGEKWYEELKSMSDSKRRFK